MSKEVDGCDGYGVNCLHHSEILQETTNTEPIRFVINNNEKPHRGRISLGIRPNIRITPHRVSHQNAKFMRALPLVCFCQNSIEGERCVVEAGVCGVVVALGRFVRSAAR